MPAAPVQQNPPWCPERCQVGRVRKASSVAPTASAGTKMPVEARTLLEMIGIDKTDRQVYVLVLILLNRVSPVAPTASAGTNMPVEAPTPLVHIMST